MVAGKVHLGERTGKPIWGLAENGSEMPATSGPRPGLPCNWAPQDISKLQIDVG
jgi:hypothetical protein